MLSQRRMTGVVAMTSRAGTLETSHMPGEARRAAVRAVRRKSRLVNGRLEGAGHVAKFGKLTSFSPHQLRE